MKFSLVWDRGAQETYNMLKMRAEASLESREKSQRKRPSKDEGLFKQVRKCIQQLQINPRHPSLQTHEFVSLPHPYHKDQKVFVAYAQQNTPAAYRVFWCYGPDKKNLTIIATKPHP
jgi:ribosomal protein L1